MNQTKTFKLIVTATDKCLEVLRYLDKNIVPVNKLGVRVQVEKISKAEFDEAMVETLRKKGITRLPTLLAPDGKLFIGIKSIIDLFEKNLRNVRNDERVSPINDPYGGPATTAEMGSNPDLTDFYMRELYAGCDNRGKMIPRKDKDEGEDEGADIEKRLADYRRNVPHHRRTDTNHDREIDRAPRQRSIRDEEDNIADSDEGDGYDEPSPSSRPPGGNRNAPRLSPTGDACGDDMDRRMLAAWMNNNAGEI